METQTTYPVLDGLAWHIIGYEEYRLGHNRLLSQNLTHLVPAYHTEFNELRFRLAWLPRYPHTWPPNGWHFDGCVEAYEFWSHLTPGEQRQPLTPYCSTPDLSRYQAETGDRCDWCDRKFVSGYQVVDFLQEHIFCSMTHAVQHREQICLASPEITYVYQHYRLQGLPLDPLRIQRYMEKLPSTRGDAVKHGYIKLPTVKRRRPTETAAEVSSGNSVSPITFEDSVL